MSTSHSMSTKGSPLEEKESDPRPAATHSSEAAKNSKAQEPYFASKWSRECRSTQASSSQQSDAPRTEPQYAASESPLELKASIVKFYDDGKNIETLESVRQVAYSMSTTPKNPPPPKEPPLPQETSSPKEPSSLKEPSPKEPSPLEKPPPSPRFTWIHLPATNMAWMKDCARSKLYEKEKSALFHLLDPFFRRSWFESLDSRPKTQYMKPRCKKTKHTAGTEQGNGKSPSGGQDTGEAGAIALYMPFLILANECSPCTSDCNHPSCKAREAYDKLLDVCHSDDIIHGSRTLDESYYHLTTGTNKDDKVEKDMRHRNGTQVITKHLGDSTDTLVRVNQLWLWIIDDATVLTSSTHPVDGIPNPILDRVFDHFEKKTDKHGAPYQPADVHDLSRLIVQVCIDFYEHDWREQSNGRGSIRSIFSNAINNIAIRETQLFQDFQKANESVSRTTKTQHMTKNIRVTTEVLSEIKDVLDELNIIKTIVDDQEGVQSKLVSGVQPSPTRSAANVLRDIEEMTKRATRLKSAVETTLMLGQNGISLVHAEASVNQGDTVLVFTIVTILFVPSSFLSTLFAIDIASFLQGPSWAYSAIAAVFALGLILTWWFAHKHFSTKVHDEEAGEAGVKKDDHS